MPANSAAEDTPVSGLASIGSDAVARLSARGVTAGCLLFLILLAWAITLQWLSGAYGAEFSGYEDEPAHYVTGLMVRDYLASGFSSPPLRYAEDYYFHYPKVAFGMWGPLQHVLEGLWMLLFSPSRVSILVLMALIATCLAFILARLIAAEYGWTAGSAIGIAFLSLGVVQGNTNRVMADNLCGLMTFCALLYFGRYLDSERRKDAILFGVFAALSGLTKGSGFELILVVPLGLLLTRRFYLLRRLDFWIPAAILIIFAGPSAYVSRRILSGDGDKVMDWKIAAAYGPVLLMVLGKWLFPVALVGFYDRIVRKAFSKKLAGIWVAMAAMIPSFWLFHFLIPTASAEWRYAVSVAGPLLMFFTAGIACLATWLPARVPYPVRVAVLSVAAACIFVKTSFAVPRKLSYGFSEAAEVVAAQQEPHGTVVLVSSAGDPPVGDGEGMAVSEIAMRDQRPDHIVLRATKLLARVNWHGDKYQLLRGTTEEAMAYLESIPVRILILDRNRGTWDAPHHPLLIEMVAKYPERWQLLGAFPKNPPAGAPDSRIEVYKLVGGEDRPRKKIRLDLRYTLGKWIER